MLSHLSMNLKVPGDVKAAAQGSAPNTNTHRIQNEIPNRSVAGACQIRLSASASRSCVFPACSNLHANGSADRTRDPRVV